MTHFSERSEAGEPAPCPRRRVRPGSPEPRAVFRSRPPEGVRTARRPDEGADPPTHRARAPTPRKRDQRPAYGMVLAREDEEPRGEAAVSRKEHRPGTARPGGERAPPSVSH